MQHPVFRVDLTHNIIVFLKDYSMHSDHLQGRHRCQRGPIRRKRPRNRALRSFTTEPPASNTQLTRATATLLNAITQSQLKASNTHQPAQQPQYDTQWHQPHQPVTYTSTSNGHQPPAMTQENPTMPHPHMLRSQKSRPTKNRTPTNHQLTILQKQCAQPVQLP